MRVFGKFLVIVGLLIVGTGIGVGIDRGSNSIKTKKPQIQPSGKK